MAGQVHTAGLHARLRNVNVEPDGVRIRKVVGMLIGVDGVVVEDLRVDVSRGVLVVVVRSKV